MTDSSVNIQIAPESVPTLPCWFAEVAIVAQFFTTSGLLQAIEQRVRFARPRFGTYEVIDFIVVLFGYAISAEPTLQAFYERLTPFASTFMALFNRQALPHRSTLSRFLAALDQPTVEALRALFQYDLVARTAQMFPPGGLWDRLGVTGSLPMWMAPNKPHDNERFPNFPLPIDVLTGCVLPPT